MNNDDFLTKHKMRPDADFVENLYQKLQQNEKQVIRMNANPFRFKRWHTFASAFAFAGITILAALYWAAIQTPNNHLITVRQDQFEPIAVFPSIEDLRADQPELIEGVINNNQNEAASDTSTNKPDQYRIDGLVNEPQKFNNQGPANLAIVLSFYGDETTQDEAASNLKPNAQDRNVSPWEISQFVNDYTELSAIARSNGSSELLKNLIANDFPVVIETGFEADIAGEASWYGHYRVIYGFDDVKQMFNTIDTFLGPFTERDVNNSGDQSLADGYTISYDQLLTDWQQFNYTFYVVYESTRKDKLLSILGEDYITETANWRAAVERAEADVSLAPENAFAWFNLGT
ncbi:MAG: C39 family peptidase, partial [Chloroflexota bacterium]